MIVVRHTERDGQPLLTFALLNQYQPDMVILSFSLQSYFKSSTAIIEKETVNIPHTQPHTLNSCSFCWNESSGSKFKVVYEVRMMLNSLAMADETGIQDDSFVAFADRKPASRHHFLVIPKRHIGVFMGHKL